LNQNLMQIHPD